MGHLPHFTIRSRAMTQTTQSVSPLRQRMIDDMMMRKLSPKTQYQYIRSVKNLTRYLGRSPDTATAEDLRKYQLHLVSDGVSRITLNANLTALKFFFITTLDRADVLTKISTVPVPRKLPVVLSLEEAARLISAAGNPKYKAALSVAYGAGLRVSEVIALKVSDIDSDRKILRVEQGKGRKDRYAMLSPLLIDYLRAWWRFANKQRLMLKGGWLPRRSRSAIGSNPCARSSGFFTPNAPLPDPRPCWLISPAIPTGLPLPTAVSSHWTNRASPSSGRTTGRRNGFDTRP